MRAFLTYGGGTIHGTPPIVFSLFLANLTANQRGDYERMRRRHTLMIQIPAAVAKEAAVTPSVAREDSQLDLRETLLTFYQPLTAVVLDVCLKK